MKKLRTLTALTALTLGLATGYGVQQDAKDDLTDQVTALEERLDAVEAYLGEQVRADAAETKAIDAAVDQGFTAGINFEARKTLVGAWKARARAAAKHVPGAKKDAEAKRVDPRLTRRR